MKEQASVKIDNDQALDYDKAGYFYSWFSYLISILFLLVPKSLLRKIIRLSNPAQRVVETATTHEALELLYIEPNNHNPQKSSKSLTRFWFHLRNPKAVRNRLKLVKKLLKQYSEKKDHIRILSLGAGSARAVLETVKELESSKKTFDISLLDLSSLALETSRELATSLGVKSNITYYNEKLSTSSVVFSKKFDIVEMVGLLDYLHDEKARDVFQAVKDCLDQGGTFITCNISNNIEKRFVTEIIDWKMKYREGFQLVQMLSDTGFSNAHVIYEPLKIHAVAIGEKV